MALTRLQGEHEFTACYAAGVPLGRLAAPLVRIGRLFRPHQPGFEPVPAALASRAMRQELFNIKNDLLSTLVKEGDFANSESGLTVYVQRIDPERPAAPGLRAHAIGRRPRPFLRRQGRPHQEGGRQFDHRAAQRFGPADDRQRHAVQFVGRIQRRHHPLFHQHRLPRLPGRRHVHA
ncbi:MAG: LptF/LptG family permease [Asticcacaulis sp.]